MTIDKSPISILQEMAQMKSILPPVYDVQPKGKEFCVTVKLGINTEIFTEAVAKTKQLAKQLCAINALELLNRKNIYLVQDSNENLSAKFWESSISSENFVGMLNEFCAKKMVAVPQYNECGSVNGKFLIECKMFDNFVTQGQSKTKKGAKQKAAEAMLKVYNGNERTRICTYNEMTCKSSSPNEAFENYVGKLNEICSKKQLVPSYSECGTINGEFIIECRISDNTITRGQSKTKKDAKQKAAEAMLNQIGELENQKPTKSFAESDDIVELYKSIKSTKPFENYVGRLIEICIKKMLPLPIYTEWTTESGEFAMDCKVIYKSVSTVTQGYSRSKQGAKEKSAKEMIKILTQCEIQETQTLMKSVSIVETDNTRQQLPTKKFTEHIMLEQSDLFSVVYMNEEQLKMELANLNVIHKISRIDGIKNALMLKTKSTRNSKSFTFIATGNDNEKIYLDLLRKAVFGMRILKTNLESVLE